LYLLHPVIVVKWHHGLTVLAAMTMDKKMA